jgi:hypothetical protein
MEEKSGIASGTSSYFSESEWKVILSGRAAVGVDEKDECLSSWSPR